MTDIVLITALMGFIALCVAYVGWCDRIIGPDDPATERSSMPDDSSRIAATTTVKEDAS